MNARRRLGINHDLEPNLYQFDGYFKYKHPQTGKFHGMGKNKKAANTAARKLNAILIQGSDLTHRVISDGANHFSDVLERYRKEYLPTKKLKERTLSETEYRLNRLERDLSKMLVIDMSVRFMADYLDNGFKSNAYVKMRGLLVDIFRFALTKGIVDDNPVESTLAKAAEEKQRMPLSHEWYKAIHALAEPWLKNAMDFGLVTLQRRGDLCLAKFDDVKDGYLQIISRKTESFGNRSFLKIKVDGGLADVVRAARTSGIASPYIVHRRPEKVVASKDKTHWTQVRPEILSKEFAALRDLVPEIAKLKPEQRPTFHEIRSLGGHLYLQAGFTEEYVQTLMAHSTAKMTAHYTDRHEPEWTIVEAIKCLK